jgi:hypothetical protein
MWLLSSMTEEEVVAKIKPRSLQIRNKRQLEKEDAEDVCEATRTRGELLSAASLVGAPSQEPLKQVQKSQQMLSLHVSL